MWLLKLELKHKCIIGNRCKQFKCTSTGYPLDQYIEKEETHYLHFEKIDGKEENIQAFLEDLKKEKNIIQFEANNNTVFFVCKARKKEEMPAQVSLASKKVFHSKPVFVDYEGVEHWEVVAWKREDINDFIKFLKQKTKDLQTFTIKTIKKTKVNDLFFPQLMPKITLNQKTAFDLAIKEGYYDYPRNTELANLAKIMNISLSTYREHLRKAEKAMLPQLQKKAFS